MGADVIYSEGDETSPAVLHLMFDKSAFQGTKDAVHERVRASYDVVTPPTLLTEIGRDLEVDRDFGEKTPKERAKMLATKFGGHVFAHHHWPTLCRRDLLGAAVAMRQGPIIARGTEAYVNGQLQEFMTYDADGVLVSPQKNWVARLVNGTWSTRYPADTRVPATEFLRMHGSLRGEITPVKRLQDQAAGEALVVAEVERMLADPKLQWKLLAWTAEALHSHVIPAATTRKRVSRRWRVSGKPPFKDFAPYAYFCARVTLLYLIGFDVWPKGRELHDLADLDYLRLLPFADVFVADDKFQRALAKHLLRSKQTLACSCALEKATTGHPGKREAECQRLHGGAFHVAP
ncbi:MAG: hypothetical protein RLZZ450_5431 [Pseudomonadota bacterium]